MRWMDADWKMMVAGVIVTVIIFKFYGSEIIEIFKNDKRK